MKVENFDILLADDDEDDCMFFKIALEELSLPTVLNQVSNGVELMNFLGKNQVNLPQVLFLDLNMPLKTGLECLTEIKKTEKLSKLPVIIYSTSSNPEVMNLLYEKGAQYYIRKPSDYKDLKTVINKALLLCLKNNKLQPTKENFLIHP